MNAERTHEICETILDEVGRAIVGKREVMERVLLAILCNGHVLFEDYPGLAKTMMAKCFAAASGCKFKRVQFTPDLLPADITGTYVFNQSSTQFEFKKGPIFTNILLGDEINRAPPKTQAALLESMQERQVTMEGRSHPLPDPFVVIATQNPIEYEGTYSLPEAQMDRFLLRTEVRYPSHPEEEEILSRRRSRKKEDVEMERVCSPEVLKEMQDVVEEIHLDDSLQEYVVEIVGKTRDHTQLEVGASPRGSLALMRLGMARAALNGRDYVIPDDIKSMAVPALSHRIILSPDPWIRGVRPESIIEKIL